MNGGFSGEATFSGKRPHRLDLPVPASLLREGANELSVVNVGDTGVSSLVFLDRFELSYPQASTMQRGVFEGVWGQGGTVEVGGLSAPACHPEGLRSARSRRIRRQVAHRLPGDGLPSVRFQAEAGHRYLVVSRRGSSRPGRAGASLDTQGRTNQADYLVIGPRAFLGAAQPLLERRREQGLTSRAVSFEEIASEFGHGQPTAEAIKAFLSYAYHSWQRPSPRYVVLLGDAT